MPVLVRLFLLRNEIQMKKASKQVRKRLPIILPKTPTEMAIMKVPPISDGIVIHSPTI